jgi:predicted nucleotidyltransferase
MRWHERWLPHEKITPMAVTPLDNGDTTMARKGRAQATSPIPDWATLRPPVTETLLADITRRIVEKFQPYKVVLFGSYAYGTPDLDSDVDLLVVMDSDESIVQRIRRVTEVAKVRFVPMDIIVRTPAELAERLAMGDFFLAEILEKGKVLYRRESSC